MPTTFSNSTNFKSSSSSSSTSSTPDTTKIAAATPPLTLDMFESALSNPYHLITALAKLVNSPSFQKFELFTANPNRDNAAHLIFGAKDSYLAESSEGRAIIATFLGHPQIAGALLARNAQNNRPYQLAAARPKVCVEIFLKVIPQSKEEVILDFSNQRDDDITKFVERILMTLVEKGVLTWARIGGILADWISKENRQSSFTATKEITHGHYVAILPLVGQLHFGYYSLNTRDHLRNLIRYYQEMLAAMPDDLRNRTLQQWIDHPPASDSENDLLQYCLREDFYQLSKHKFSMLQKQELVAYLIENELPDQLKIVLANEPELVFCTARNAIIPILSQHIDQPEVLALLTAHPTFAITSTDVATMIENERIKLLLYFIYAGATLDAEAYASIATAGATFPDLRKLQRAESLIINSVGIDLHASLEQHAIPTLVRTTLNSQLHASKQEAIEKKNIAIFLTALVANLAKLLRDQSVQLDWVLNDISFALNKQGIKLPTIAATAAPLVAVKPDAVMGISMFYHETGQNGAKTPTADYVGAQMRNG